MDIVRKIVRKYLNEMYDNGAFENKSKPGEYSTDEMEEFLFKLIDLIPFDGTKNISIPSSWPASSVSYSRENIIKSWEEAKRNNPEPDTKFYVWKADTGGIATKPKLISAQRMDLNSILSIVSHYPNSFRSMSIGVENESTEIKGRSIDTKGD